MNSLLISSYQKLWPPILSFAIVIGAFLSDGISAEPQGRYYRIDFTELKYENESFEAVREVYLKDAKENAFDEEIYVRPSIRLADGGEYFPVVTEFPNGEYWTRLDYVVRLDANADTRGSIVFKVGNKQTKKLEFKLEPADADPELHDLFWSKRGEYYRDLSSQNRSSAGAAWFRYQYRKSVTQLSDSPESASIREQILQTQRFNNSLNEERTYALVTGGRAISENLQLHDPLFVRADQEPTIAIDSLEGITVREFDWEKLTQGLTPSKDVLASAVPYDQHGVFFRDFRGVVELVDQLKSQGSDFVVLANAGAQDAETRKFYERQLCLSLDSATRLLGAQMIKSLALTGGDLYLRTGTDIALLIEPTSAGEKTLLPLLATQIAARASKNPEAKQVSGRLGDIAYTGFRSEDRRISTYLAKIGGNVVVTNSLAQLERLRGVAERKVDSLASLDEFTFFRHRYSLESEHETAFVFISDATIRRWCGPQWRITSARRTRAVAKMAELQAANMDDLVHQRIKTKTVDDTGIEQIKAGLLQVTPSGVQSDVYGSLEFQTPIGELDVTKVSKAEADGYGRWRAGYQSRWRNFFDPIGIQLSLREGVIESDVTVMPLIAGTDYRELIDVSEGSSLNATSGDPHAESVMHFVLSLNHESEMLSDLNRNIGNFIPGIQVDLFSWIGDSFSIYADQSSFWDEWLKVAEAADSGRGFESREATEFLQANLNRLPVAVRLEISSGLRLGLFLAAIRGFAESAAPGLLQWETLKHNEQPFVSIASPMLSEEGELPDDLRIYYLATGQQLLISLDKDMITRAIDREKARKDGKEIPAGKQTWIGSNLGVKMTEQMTRLYMPLIEEATSRDMQRLSWGNLTILNEWKRRYPDQDPVEVHRKFWQRRLLCPGGGEYVWNEVTQQMESSVFGSRSNPKMPTQTPVPKLLRELKSGEFGVSFEDGGVRARVQLNLK